MKKITLLLLLSVTFGFAQTVNVKVIVDASAPGLYPDATYTNLCLNGTFAPGEEWWGWGIALVDDGTGDDAVSGDGIWTGSRDIAENFDYEFVLAGTGAGDGWSGWGIQTGYNSATCGGAGGNYTFSTVTSDLELSLSVLPADDGEGNWGDCLTVSTLSVSKSELNQVKTFPNPVQNEWNIQTTGQNITTIQVFDLLGKNVMSMTPNSNSVKLDTSNLKTGLYFANLTTDNNEVQSFKLIKK